MLCRECDATKDLLSRAWMENKSLKDQMFNMQMHNRTLQDKLRLALATIADYEASSTRGVSASNRMSPLTIHSRTSSFGSTSFNKGRNPANSNFVPKIELANQEALEVGLLLSKQDSMYGTNMFESLTDEDEDKIEQCIRQGMSRNEAANIIFEQKVRRPILHLTPSSITPIKEEHDGFDESLTPGHSTKLFSLYDEQKDSSNSNADDFHRVSLAKSSYDLLETNPEHEQGQNNQGSPDKLAMLRARRSSSSYGMNEKDKEVHSMSPEEHRERRRSYQKDRRNSRSKNQESFDDYIHGEFCSENGAEGYSTGTEDELINREIRSHSAQQSVSSVSKESRDMAHSVLASDLSSKALSLNSFSKDEQFELSMVSI